MKHAILRAFMKSKNVRKEHILKDCAVVMDGDSYFRGAYKDSGCHFMLGGDFDRYADYLRTTLAYFKVSNVTLYVVFNGGMKSDVEKRKEIHQKLITEKISIVPGDEKAYYEPVFVKDVNKQVLEELVLKYYVCEYDSRETLHDVSRDHNCPVITNNIENCLLGMSCITPSSIKYDTENKQISCKILTPELVQSFVSVSNIMKPIFLVILDENGPLYEKIPEIVATRYKSPVVPVAYWVRRQRRDQAITDLAKKLSTEHERRAFKESIEDLRKLISYHRRNSGARYFNTKTTSDLSSKDKDWFKKGVMTGRIAIPYINLKNYGTFSGSWVICDKEKDDAMLPALDIVMYANGVLTNSPKNSITFIGRISEKSIQNVISCDFKSELSIKGIFKDHSEYQQKPHEAAPDSFKSFVDKALPDLDWPLLEGVPEDAHMLMIAMLYYVSKAGRDFYPAACSVLLSYVMLGPVSQKVGLIKRSKLVSSLDAGGDRGDSECSYRDCLTASHALIDFFYEGDLKKTFDRSVLHELAAFQHCLQQMNYLNKLCGERVKCTCYYRTYNGTFVFNVLLRMREHKDPIDFVEKHLKGSPSVLQFYKRVKEAFDNCLAMFVN